MRRLLREEQPLFFLARIPHQVAEFHCVDPHYGAVPRQRAEIGVVRR
jgi:hypothetical protein